MPGGGEITGGYRKLKVGVRFCGGCNPDYDWEEFWREVKRIAGDEIEWVRWVEEEREALLLINCCQTACGEEEVVARELPGKVVSVRGGASPEEVVARLMSIEKERE